MVGAGGGWREVVPLLTPLELVLVTLLSLRREAEVELPIAALAAEARANPTAVRRTLRGLNGRLLEYESARGRGGRARIRLRSLAGEDGAAARQWLEAREKGELGSSGSGRSRPGAADWAGSAGKAAPGSSGFAGDTFFMESDPELAEAELRARGVGGIENEKENEHEHDPEGGPSSREIGEDDGGLGGAVVQAVERVTFEVCGRFPTARELAMWRELFCERGLTLPQLARGIAEVRERMPGRPRTMNYFRPRLLEVLNEDRERERLRDYRPAAAGGAGRRAGAAAAGAGGERWRSWAADARPLRGAGG